MINRISFQRLDYPSPALEPFAEDFAEFLLANPIYFTDFCEFLRFSTGWRKINYRERLDSWKRLKIGRANLKNSNTQKFVEFVDRFFYSCQNDSDIEKMRGLVPEKLLEKIFYMRYSSRTHKQDHGCSVSIDGEEVRYICPDPYDIGDDSDKDRRTVDIGTWDGIEGEFAEIKVSPDSFHTKEIKYLRVLANKLKINTINHKIYLIALKERQLTQERLARLTEYIEGEFDLIGRDEIFNLQQVI